MAEKGFKFLLKLSLQRNQQTEPFFYQVKLFWVKFILATFEGVTKGTFL